VAQGDEGRYNPSLSDTLIDYDRGEYLESSSPYMIWVLEKSKRP